MTAATDWQRELDELKRLVESANNDLNQMTGFERKGNRDAFIRFKRDSREKITAVANRLPIIGKQLQSAQNDPSLLGITQGEWLRRKKALKQLGRDYNEVKKLFEKPSERYAQYGHNYQGGRDNPMDTQQTMNMTNQQIKQLHQDRREQHEEDLEELLQGVKRVHEITEDIVVEVDRQGRVIKDIDDNMDKAERKLSGNLKRVDYLSKKSKDKGCCCLMAILFIAIIAMLIWILGA